MQVEMERRSERRKRTKRATVSKSIPPIIPIFPAIETRRAVQNSRLAAFSFLLTLRLLSLSHSFVACFPLHLFFHRSRAPSFSVAPQEEQTATATGSRATRGIAGSDDNIKLVVLAVASRRGVALRWRRHSQIHAYGRPTSQRRANDDDDDGDGEQREVRTSTSTTTTKRKTDAWRRETKTSMCIRYPLRAPLCSRFHPARNKHTAERRAHARIYDRTKDNREELAVGRVDRLWAPMLLVAVERANQRPNSGDTNEERSWRVEGGRRERVKRWKAMRGDRKNEEEPRENAGRRLLLPCTFLYVYLSSRDAKKENA